MNKINVAVVGLDEFDALDKHAAGAAAGVVNFAFVRLDHFGNQVYDAFRRIEFALAFAFGQRELAQEVFIHASDNIVLFILNGVNVMDGVQQGGQFACVQAEPGIIVIRQCAFQ